jgi:hypothetical protein
MERTILVGGSSCCKTVKVIIATALSPTKTYRFASIVLDSQPSPSVATSH